jgi:hypothetical protein
MNRPNIIQDVIGKNSFPEWALNIEADVGSILNEEDIHKFLDFNIGDNGVPPHHKTTYLHTNYSKSYTNIPSKVVRMEFRIGEKRQQWTVGDYETYKLENSEYYINKHHSDGDKTYVNFYFRLPRTLERFVSEYRKELDEIN